VLLEAGVGSGSGSGAGAGAGAGAGLVFPGHSPIIMIPWVRCSCVLSGTHILENSKVCSNH
jgi:hypothetical protein